MNSNTYIKKEKSIDGYLCRKELENSGGDRDYFSIVRVYTNTC